MSRETGVITLTDLTECARKEWKKRRKITRATGDETPLSLAWERECMGRIVEFLDQAHAALQQELFSTTGGLTDE